MTRPNSAVTLWLSIRSAVIVVTTLAPVISTYMLEARSTTMRV